MDPAEQAALAAAIDAVTTLRQSLLRNGSKRIRSKGDQDQIKATVATWFQTYRPPLLARSTELHVANVDLRFNELLDCAERATARTSYLALLKSLREELMAVRARGLALPPPAPATLLQSAPDLSGLIANADLRAIVLRRWTETQVCIQAGAHLAAVFMIGGLLEGLLLARILIMKDQRPAHTARSSPKDGQGKTRPLSEWTLNNYLEVAHELGWIGTPTRTVSGVLRDYRNLIHPQRELSERVVLKPGETIMFWSVFSAIANQIIASV